MGLFESAVSQQSVFIESNLSVLSRTLHAAEPTSRITTVTTSSASRAHSSRTSPTAVVAPTSSPTLGPASYSAFPSHTSNFPTPSAEANVSDSNGPSGGALAAIVILTVLGAALVAFLLKRWHSKQAGVRASGLWLESPAYLGGRGVGESSPNSVRAPGFNQTPGTIRSSFFGRGGGSVRSSNRPTTYVFDGSPSTVYPRAIATRDSRGNFTVTPRPVTVPPATPEKDLMQLSPALSPQAGLISPVLNPFLTPEPSPVHAPRSRSPDGDRALQPTPLAYVQETLARYKQNNALDDRRDSGGPTLLYSTPRAPALTTSEGSYRANALHSTTPIGPIGQSADQKLAIPSPVPVPRPTSLTVPPAYQPYQPTHARRDSITPRSSISTVKTGQTTSSGRTLFQRLTFSRSTLDSLTNPPPLPPSMPSVFARQQDLSNRKQPRLVIRTYVPTLLDELQVSVGDYVHVVNEYDDGWGYCEKLVADGSRADPEGRAGVVPMECLLRPGDAPPSGIDLPESGSGSRSRSTTVTRESVSTSTRHSVESTGTVRPSPSRKSEGHQEGEGNRPFSKFEVNFEGLK